MFAEAAGALLLTAQSITIPFGHPRVIEQPKAPIETSGPLWASTCDGSRDRNKAAPPVRIHGNSYLVGTCGLSAMLIVGDQGDILIDGGAPEDTDLIADNIRELGYSPSNIRFILHSDDDGGHLGGIGKLQRMSGATVGASARAASIMHDGLPDAIMPAEVGRTVKDGDEVRLGNLLLTAIASSEGSLSWRWVSCDGGICRTIVYAATLTPGPTGDPSDAADPAAIGRLAATPCDILVTADPSASDMAKRLVLGQPLFDANACKAYAAQASAALDAQPAKQPSK